MVVILYNITAKIKQQKEALIIMIRPSVQSRFALSEYKERGIPINEK